MENSPLDISHPIIFLKCAYQDFYNCILSLPDKQFITPMNGWSPRDVVAHLVGWNLHMIAASNAILAGETPSYYADAVNDYKNINAGFVAQYASLSKSEMLSLLESSLDEFEQYVLSIPPAELQDSHGVQHYSGRPSTVAGIIASLAEDYQHHLDQVSAWLQNR